jgi:hypothetical protein
MDNPYPRHGNLLPPTHPYGWAEPPRRRRLNAKGWAVLLVLLALLCGLALGALKLGLYLWQSPVTSQAAKSAARIGTVAADAAMAHYEVPKDVRAAVKEESALLQKELFKGADPRQRPAGEASVDAPTH